MLDKDWVWHDFMNAIEDGEISSLLKGIKEKVGNSVEINILIDIPKINKSREITLKDQAFSDLESGATVILESLPQWLRNIEDIEWYWIDIYLQFRIKKIPPQTGGEWTDYEIVEQLLVPFEKWVR